MQLVDVRVLQLRLLCGQLSTRVLQLRLCGQLSVEGTRCSCGRTRGMLGPLCTLLLVQQACVVVEGGLLCHAFSLKKGHEAFARMPGPSCVPSSISW